MRVRGVSGRRVRDRCAGLLALLACMTLAPVLLGACATGAAPAPLPAVSQRAAPVAQVRPDLARQALALLFTPPSQRTQSAQEPAEPPEGASGYAEPPRSVAADGAVSRPS